LSESDKIADTSNGLLIKHLAVKLEGNPIERAEIISRQKEEADRKKS